MDRLNTTSFINERKGCCRYCSVMKMHHWQARTMSNIHRRRDSTRPLSRVGIGGVSTIRNQLTTTANGYGRHFGNWQNRLHGGLSTWILIDTDNLFNDVAIMSSLVTNLNSSTAQEIINWVTTANGWVHTGDTTPLSSCVVSASAVCIWLVNITMKR